MWLRIIQVEEQLSTDIGQVEALCRRQQTATVGTTRLRLGPLLRVQVLFLQLDTHSKKQHAHGTVGYYQY